MDFGSSFKASISKIRYYPNQIWTSAGIYLIGAKFFGSNDNTNWDLLYTVDNTVHTGYNIWRPSPALLTNYRYIKFQHNSTSKCQLANLEFYGILYQTDLGATLDSYKVDATFTDGFHTVSWPQIVEYRTDATPIVTSI